MIFEFYGLECSHCESMKPVVEKLRKEGVVIESFEIWHQKENLEKLHTYDKGYCGGVPFFVNPETNRWICGEASYDELKSLAQ